jgi:hypothetical protein
MSLGMAAAPPDLPLPLPREPGVQRRTSRPPHLLNSAASTRPEPREGGGRPLQILVRG